MKQKIADSIRVHSVQNRIVVISVVFMFVSMMIIGIYMSFILYSKSLEASYKEMTIYVDKTIENIDQSFSFVSNTALAVAGSKTFLGWIHDPSILNEDSENYFRNIHEMDREIKYVLSYSSAWRSNYISFISIYVNDKLINYTYSKPISGKEIIKKSNTAFEHVNENYGNQIILPFVNTDYVFHTLKLKYDFSSNSSLVILIATEESVLREQFTGSILTDDSKTYLLNEDNIIFSSNDTSLIGQRCDDEIINSINYSDLTYFDYNNKRYVAIAKKLNSAGLIYLTMIPHENIIRQAFIDLPFFIVLALLLCVLLMIIGTIISLKSTLFIKDITYALGCVKEENYDVKMPYYNNDAINMISDSFNSMTSEIKKLIDLTYKSKIMLQEMELEYLQQQIKPHFIFNIMLIIQIKAKQNENETVYNMLTSLSGLLRSSLYSDRNVFTTLKDEMKCVEYYLYLQKQRFGDRLRYKIIEDENLQDLKIPRLTIEPIVENAVIHAGLAKNLTIDVSINIYDKDDHLDIEVTDNGVGFDPNEIDFEKNDLNSIREHVGLKNTHSRLKLLFGEDSGITVESKLNEGTRVIIRIPKSINRKE